VTTPHPQRTGPRPLGEHPLADADVLVGDAGTTAPEAADWLKHPEPPQREPTQAELWDAEPAWTGPIPSPQDLAHDPDDEDHEGDDNE
jgi:hypothetical protein